jgi:hypothetical protein
MANLSGQNIGTNYKGMINIGSTVNQNISASLQSLTDGDGNNLPIQVSTNQVIIGGGSSLARFVVRGDGTNPISIFEALDGTSVLSLPVAATNTGVLRFRGFYMSFANNTSQLIGIENGTFVFFNTANRFTVSSTGLVTLTNTLNLVAATTARATMNIPSGVAPTSPANGDVWYDGTDLFFRQGTTTRRFSFI